VLINLNYQHGWGFASESWHKMIPEQNHYSIFIADRGYFSGSNTLTGDNDYDFNVTICHSLGVHLCAELLDNSDLLVVLAGFKHFHGENRSEGVLTRRHVQRMLKQLSKDPAQLLNIFYRDCSYFKERVNFKEIDLKLLKSDLELLDTHVLNLDAINKVPDVLILHGSHDRIVSPQRGRFLAESISNSTFVEISGAGHGLPFTHPKECWQIIQEKIQKVQHTNEQ
jgi:hypothetical protein